MSKVDRERVKHTNKTEQGEESESRSQPMPPPINTEMVVQDEVSQLRRSNRNTQVPRRYDDFEVDFYIEIHELLLALNEDEPTTYHEGKSNPLWVKAMEEEIDSIEKNETWKLVKRPYDKTIIRLKWVYKIKRDGSISISKYKDRIVAKRYLQQHGIDFKEVFTYVVRIETVSSLIALATSKGWELHHPDMKYAFLHGEL